MRLSALSVVCLYCTVNWLPVLIADRGLPLQTAILAVGAFNIGSVIGNIILAGFADRATPYLPTAVFYFLGAIFLAVVGVSGPTVAGLLLGAGMSFATLMTLLGGLMLIAGFAVLCLGRAQTAYASRTTSTTLKNHS